MRTTLSGWLRSTSLSMRPARTSASPRIPPFSPDGVYGRHLVGIGHPKGVTTTSPRRASASATERSADLAEMDDAVGGDQSDQPVALQDHESPRRTRQHPVERIDHRSRRVHDEVVV